MRMTARRALGSAILVLTAIPAGAQNSTPTTADTADPIEAMVGAARPREIQGHHQGAHAVRRSAAGHRSQPAAIDWIEAQLKSYGCTNTERITYDFQPPRPRPRRGRRHARSGAAPAARPVTGAGRRAPARHPRAHRREQRFARAARRAPARAQRAAEHARRAAEGVLHEGRHHASRRDVHRRRAHGRHRLGRGRERRRLRHGDRDGAGARLQQPGRADGALDPLRALEQRGDGPERRARVRRAAPGAAGQGRAGGLGQVSGAQVARHDPARHDDVRPRHAARRRHAPTGAASRGRREHRVPVDLEDGRRSRRSSRGPCTPRTRSTRRTIRRRSART